MRRDEHGPELPTSRQRSLEPRPAIVLARRHILMLADQGPALAFNEGPNAGLLRLASRVECRAAVVRICAWVRDSSFVMVRVAGDEISSALLCFALFAR
ncbi:hypothetical protein [Roseomonas sp. WA12]